MGGADAIIEKTKAELREGRLSLGTAGLNQVDYVDPSNTDARNLMADAGEQLGYVRGTTCAHVFEFMPASGTLMKSPIPML